MSNTGADQNWKWEMVRGRGKAGAKIMESDFFFLPESDILMLLVQLFFLASSTFRNANSKPKIKMGPRISSLHPPCLLFQCPWEDPQNIIISKYDLSTHKVPPNVIRILGVETHFIHIPYLLHSPGGLEFASQLCRSLLLPPVSLSLGALFSSPQLIPLKRQLIRGLVVISLRVLYCNKDFKNDYWWK